MAKSDARVRYTEEVIRREFLKLLREKPITRITVSEICRNAQINRATFYKHYMDVYDLLDHIEKEITDSFHEKISRIGSTGLREGMLDVLRALKAEPETYFALFGKNGDLSFPSRIISSFFPLYHASDLFQENRKEDKSLRKMYYAFLSAGATGVVTSWIAENFGTPEETVADTIVMLCNGTERAIRQQRAAREKK